MNRPSPNLYGDPKQDVIHSLILTNNNDLSIFNHLHTCEKIPAFMTWLSNYYFLLIILCTQL